MAPWIAKEVRLKCEALAVKIATNHDIPYRDIIAELQEIPDAANKKRDQAASLGSTIHDLIHQDLINAPRIMPADEQIQATFNEYLTWKNVVQFQRVDVECVVWSKQHMYAGQLDTIGWVEGQLTLIDFKTSARIYKEMACQLAAYANAWQECMPKLYGADNKQIQRLKIIRLGKEKPEFEVVDFSERWTEAFDTFLALKKVWEFDKRK